MPREAESVLAGLLEERETTPACAMCSSDADFFLYEPERVRKFVCWEHVSPYAAAVDEPGEGRPTAVRL
ncbi:hypothetical protein U3A55_02810 [Salarchaeum sp. III]|uniref:hypothetical protein n=1 Tax=Salarchaeum sp. III TaxID=3107927 RepID=UPI002ED9A2B6